MNRRKTGRTANAPDTARLMVDDNELLEVDVAAGFIRRAKGLLGRRTIDRAMWLPGTTSVHTIAMRCTIDVVYLDRTGVVIDVVTMPPNRVGRPRLRAGGVVEMGAGRAAALGITRGDLLRIERRATVR